MPMSGQFSRRQERAVQANIHGHSQGPNIEYNDASTQLQKARTIYKNIVVYKVGDKTAALDRVILRGFSSVWLTVGLGGMFDCS